MARKLNGQEERLLLRERRDLMKQGQPSYLGKALSSVVPQKVRFQQILAGVVWLVSD